MIGIVKAQRHVSQRSTSKNPYFNRVPHPLKTCRSSIRNSPENLPEEICHKSTESPVLFQKTILVSQNPLVIWNRKRGRQQGGPFFGKASLLYRETVIEYHWVSDIAALQQHDRAERLETTELMSNAANVAAATPLPCRWVRNWLKCNKKTVPEP